MLGINPSIMIHQLNVSPSFLPVRQRKWVFAQERDNAIAKGNGCFLRLQLDQAGGVGLREYIICH